MKFAFQPRQFFLIALAGWINEQQQQVFEHLVTENQVLKGKIGRKRILLSDDQRRRLAVKGKALGRKLLGQIGAIVTPDTILRWHRCLIAQKWNYSDRRGKLGRPRISEETIDLEPIRKPMLATSMPHRPDVAREHLAFTGGRFDTSIRCGILRGAMFSDRLLVLRMPTGFCIECLSKNSRFRAAPITWSGALVDVAFA